MKNWLFSLHGAVMVSTLTLLSHLWRGFLDAMFVLPVDFGDRVTMEWAAIIFTMLFAGWGWAIFAAWRGSYRGLVAAFVINAVLLLAVPIGWIFFYCPAACRADAGVFNLANSLNLALGLVTAVAFMPLLLQKTESNLEGRPT